MITNHDSVWGFNLTSINNLSIPASSNCFHIASGFSYKVILSKTLDLIGIMVFATTKI
jgi:hypothetical protein